ncbi:MAG: AraC family transcriptional regulator [Anaerocolumna aminovalerica]|uniref:AraC family transcriptional regulator n=1 Tax=Anaerocolumna aminovalerica TaxID=1527 RepID=UPI00290BFA9E|nr:AraC family transcriptional regulator [Anaerocolumna aminovalerica]MDU6265424.1 AraC family transcriptional regulator [Anaerocolumna aminovalerica]
MKTNSNNAQFMFRMVFSYSTVLIILLIMGVNLYNISINNVRSDIRNQNKLMLQNAIRKLDADLTTMDALAGQVASNSKLVTLANKPDNKDKDYYLLASFVKDDLSVFIHTENLLPIDNYFIYLQQSGYVLSYSQFTDMESYYNSKRMFMPEQYDDWLNKMNDSDYNRKFISLGHYMNKTNSSYLYMLPLKNYTLRDIPAVICFEIDINKLTRIYSDLNLFNSGYLYATNNEGEEAFVLTENDTGEISADILKNLTYKDGLSEYEQDNNEMLVTYSDSEYNKWNYYLVQPAVEALYSLEQYRDIFVFIICLALSIGFLLILFLSKRNVKPMIALNNELKNTITRQRSLQMIVDEQKPIIQQSYLSRIMHGGISSLKELDYARQYLSISTDHRKFSILYIIVYVNQYELQLENSAIIGPNTENYDEIIKFAIGKYFKEEVHIYQPAEREYVLLLSNEEEEEDKQTSQKVKEVFKGFHEYLMDSYSIWSFAGLGNWDSDLMVTWKSYQQANEVVNYATKDHIVKSYACIKRDTNVFYYPMELAGQLTNFITIGNESQVLEIFKVIRHENMEEQSQSVNMMKCLFSDIKNTLFKIRFTIQTDEKNKDELKAIDAMFEEHMSLKLCEDIALSLCRLYGNKCSRSQLITNIKKYILDNYNDPSLCLNKISDEFLISESYFSYLFKEETGENFSTYLERIRMEQAVQLIKESDINISNLYQEIGYNNSNTFRRAFKKIYGISPKTMRDVTNN